jgi:hypothetical protein
VWLYQSSRAHPRNLHRSVSDLSLSIICSSTYWARRPIVIEGFCSRLVLIHGAESQPLEWPILFHSTSKDLLDILFADSSMIFGEALIIPEIRIVSLNQIFVILSQANQFTMNKSHRNWNILTLYNAWNSPKPPLRTYISWAIGASPPFLRISSVVSA